MAALTPRFRFSYFGAGVPGSISDDGQKFTALDPLLLDRLLAQIEGHDHHYAPAGAELGAAPTGVLANTGGALVGGYTYFYRFAVVDAQGMETLASPELQVITPPPLPVPGMPGLSSAPDAGALAPGYYYYALTALRGTEESTLGGATMVNLVAGETSVRIDLPALGLADSFRIWRMGAAEAGWTKIGITSDPVFTDAGAVPADPCACDPGNTPPAFNTGISSYAVTVTLPVEVDLSTARSWRLYRTVTAGIYPASSLVHEVVEREQEWDDASPLLRSWTDSGGPLVVGQPQDSDLNMRFQPFTLDAATAELPDPAPYPQHYPLVFEEKLYAKIGTNWVAIGGGGSGESASSVLTAPNGNRFIVTVANDGSLSTTPTVFPGPPTPPQSVSIS